MSRWSHWSLRRTLLAVLLPGLLLVMGLELAAGWRNALAAANTAFDRSLLGAIKSMDANISTTGGGLAVELPYQMLEFFELTASGQVFYRVASGDGLVEIGNAGLPGPPHALADRAPQFYDANYFGVPVRVGAWQRPLDRELSQGSHSDRVIVQVAETLESRQDFTRRLVWESVARDTLLLATALALVALAVYGALRPLSRLRAEVARRASDDLTPIATDRVPKDVAPLVEAINLHMQRYGRAMAQQRQFIDDASHQLRTPLTTLATQVGYALRVHDDATRTHTLAAIKTELDAAIRQTNQMLALARADAQELHAGPLDLMALAETVARRLWPLARQQGLDLGLEPLAEGGPVRAWGDAGLLEQALANLVHNALQHVPRGGQVTVQAGVRGGMALLCVRDDGPGLSAADRACAGQRFVRLGTDNTQGSGLGLSIAQAIVQRHGGYLQLDDATPGAASPGLAVVLAWPLSASPSVAEASG